MFVFIFGGRVADPQTNLLSPGGDLPTTVEIEFVGKTMLQFQIMTN